MGPFGVELPSVAPMLMQSLRAVGYTASAASADLIDNSIAADVRTAEIQFASVPEPSVIADDGSGLIEVALISAMRFGSSDPRDERTGMDLSRFGPGLQAASLSQCRRLTVASLRDGRLAVAVRVLTVWECELKADAEGVVHHLTDELRGNG